MDMQFPFMVLSRGRKVFSVCPNKEKLLEECPTVSLEWYNFGKSFQLGKINNDQIWSLNIVAEDVKEANQKIEFIYCVAGDCSFEAQDKWNVLGWLFSLCIEEIPEWFH
jgi:hypothetical protein